MEDHNSERSQHLTMIDGAMALIFVLLTVQVWLLTATLDTFLAGHRDAALPGAIVSGLLFLGCAVLYRFITRAERRSG